MGFFGGVLDLLYPPRCAFCRHILPRGVTGMCRGCADRLAPIPNGGRRTGEFFSVCVAPLWYEGEVREAVLRYKFGDCAVYAGVFGRLVAACVRENLCDRYDLVSWVPLSRRRLALRGYDQARLLACAAAQELGTQAAPTLAKPRDVPQQSSMGSGERRRVNISGAYAASDPELVRGKRVLLIDDVVTTGSTLSECARTLLMAGAKEVVCAALARTRD